jgi:hypothetical protein
MAFRGMNQKDRNGLTSYKKENKMSRRKPYKQFEIVSPHTFYAAAIPSKHGNKKVFSFVTNSPKRTMELVAKTFVNISSQMEMSYRVLHLKGAKKKYYDKIAIGWQLAKRAGYKIHVVKIIPSTIVDGKVTMKELRPVENSANITKMAKKIVEMAAE